MNRGYTNRQIAKALGVALAGANGHVNGVTTLLQGTSRYDAVRKARELGLVIVPKDGGLIHHRPTE